MDWINFLQTLGGVIAGGGLSLFSYKSIMRKKQAEADAAEADANTKEWELEEKRIKNLHESITHSNTSIDTLTSTIDALAQRLSKLNITINEYIDRNRELSDRLYQSERDLNAANDRIIKLTEERDTEKRHKEHYKQWRCEWPDCKDPRGRRPPNETIKNQIFKHPDNDHN